MRGAIHTVALEPATTAADRSADQAVTFSVERGFLAALMGRVQGWFRHKPSLELALVVGCDERTARRYFAGERTPDAIVLMRLLRSPYGVRLVEDATRDLPTKQHKLFWDEMAMATLRAAHRERLDER